MNLKISLLAIFCFVSILANAQSDSSFFGHATISLQNYEKLYPTEKVYLHLDRNYYEPGDTIWFKAYTVSGPDHMLSDISGVLYAELINNKDSLVKRLTLPLNNGLAYGDFLLDLNFDPGTYHIRAYTTWMRNDDAAYFYNQSVSVGQRFSLPAETESAPARKRADPIAKIPVTVAKTDVQFFPEGGDLVNGLRSKVAVKAVGSSGFGEDIAGVITDNLGTEVVTFNTQHLGMGAFALLPETGKTYTAKITGSDSTDTYKVDLPKAKNEGFSLTVNALRPDTIFIKVAANDAMFKKAQHTRLSVIAQQSGSICYTADAELISPVFTAAIPKNHFHSGIVQFTLFSSAGEALNERVVFVQAKDELDVQLKSDSANLAWQHNNISLLVKDSKGLPVSGSFSVAVTDEANAGQNAGSQETIFSHLLLSSDIKGYIEDPAYYFTNVTDQTRSDLDLLMLTQGYRKLEWKRILKNQKQILAYQPDKGLSLEGMVMTPSGQPVAGGKVSITSIADMLVIDTVTNADGSFRFKNLAFPDTAKIVIKALKPNNGRNVAIYLKQNDYPQINQNSGSVTGKLQMPGKNDDMLSTKSSASDTGTRHALLGQVTIKGRKLIKADRFNQYGTVAERQINLAQMKDFNSLKDAIRAKVPGVYNDATGKFYYGHQELSILINGLPRKLDEVDIYEVSDLESMRLIDGTLMSGPLLMIQTHRFFARDSIHVKLKEVKIRSKKIEKPGKSNMNGAADTYTISGDKLKALGPNLNPGLASKIPGVFYRNGVIFAIRSMGSSKPVKLHIVLNDHEIIQDEVNNDNINNYVGTDEIENIKLLHGSSFKAIYGVAYDPLKGDLDDIVLITTKQFAGTAKSEGNKLTETRIKGSANAKYVTTDLSTNLISYRFKGYYKSREFYSPKYDDPKVPRSYYPVATVYWEPGLITDKDGHASLSFYNNGNKGVYDITVEGIDSNGNLGRQVFKFRVR